MRDALSRINPALPTVMLDEVFRKLTRPEEATLKVRNRAFYRILVDRVTVKYRGDNDAVRSTQVRAVDFDDSVNSNWLAVN